MGLRPFLTFCFVVLGAAAIGSIGVGVWLIESRLRPETAAEFGNLVIVYGGAAAFLLVAIIAASSGFTQLAILANVAALTLYLMCVAASVELQRRDVRTDGVPFALPAGPVIPALAAGVIFWMLSHATRREFAVEGIVLAVASLFYLVRKRGALGPVQREPSVTA